MNKILLENKPLLNEKQYEKLENCSKDLHSICLNYPDWNDLLSLRLHLWEKDWQVITKSKNEEILNAKITQLKQEILVDPFSGGTLKEPVLEREWHWEKWVLEEWKKISPYSSYDAIEMQKPKPHRFAEKILNWMSSLQNEPICKELVLVKNERKIHVKQEYFQQINHELIPILFSQLAVGAKQLQKDIAIITRLDIANQKKQEEVNNLNSSNKKLEIQIERDSLQLKEDRKTYPQLYKQAADQITQINNERIDDHVKEGKRIAATNKSLEELSTMQKKTIEELKEQLKRF